MARDTWLSRMGANRKLSHWPSMSSMVTLDLLVGATPLTASLDAGVASSATCWGGETAAGGLMMGGGFGLHMLGISLLSC